MGCCGPSSKKPNNDSPKSDNNDSPKSDNNSPKNDTNEHDDVKPAENSKTKSVWVWVAVIGLVAGLLIWMI